MKYVLIALLAIIYVIGIWTVKFLDDTLPDEWKVNWVAHYLVLLILWIMTPVTMVFFIFFIIINKFNGKE